MGRRTEDNAVLCRNRAVFATLRAPLATGRGGPARRRPRTLRPPSRPRTTPLGEIRTRPRAALRAGDPQARAPAPRQRPADADARDHLQARRGRSCAGAGGSVPPRSPAPVSGEPSAGESAKVRSSSVTSSAATVRPARPGTPGRRGQLAQRGRRHAGGGHLGRHPRAGRSGRPPAQEREQAPDAAARRVPAHDRVPDARHDDPLRAQRGRDARGARRRGAQVLAALEHERRAPRGRRRRAAAARTPPASAGRGRSRRPWPPRRRTGRTRRARAPPPGRGRAGRAASNGAPRGHGSGVSSHTVA